MHVWRPQELKNSEAGISKEKSVQYAEWEHEVAKRIACAVTSYQAGVPYESFWQQYSDLNEEPKETNF